MNFGEMFAVVILSVMTVAILFFAFTISGTFNVKVEQSFQNEYSACQKEKQVVTDQLSYCKDIKGIKDTSGTTTMYILSLIVYFVGLGFMWYNINKKNKLDERDKAITNKEVVLNAKEIELDKRQGKKPKKNNFGGGF